jgi:hypothetical protein
VLAEDSESALGIDEMKGISSVSEQSGDLDLSLLINGSFWQRQATQAQGPEPSTGSPTGYPSEVVDKTQSWPPHRDCDHEIELQPERTAKYEERSCQTSVVVSA